MFDIQTHNQSTLDEEQCWDAVTIRSARMDGAFVFAVRSTGVYCRPSCPARRPRRENVSFFRLPAEAVAAGFRPCLRCHPDQQQVPSPHAELVEQVRQYIENNIDAPLRLADLSTQFHMSPYHLQRTFKQVTGLSPRQYAESLRLKQFKTRLQEGEPVTSALYNAGYQSSSSVYERTPMQLGMTPATYQRGGKGVHLAYTIADSPLGKVLIAATERGITAIRFGESRQALEAELEREYPHAERTYDAEHLRPWIEHLQRALAGRTIEIDIPLDVQATAFQWRVWRALQAIPAGQTRSYSEVAQAIGQPSAVRAVAQACAANHIAVFIPCHRVVRNNGQLGGYRWGIERKQRLLALEQSKRSTCE
ncbi:bifunctional DNA-binding transcriptional regulator/O6-methylguanine-DNA methyltransferase Ada [Ktedonobacter sp. SOSP1-52]|uniref:bifunctional DNA-binding transcriptional regulator/O6-methylguanine-DNA methyltransferase Ada n=1 Tax=Ktedonobacter sp. SOSP1-52 TaxID=2778366 RepID=UPI001F1AD92B|nr:bifunctional DNA-binding transcriptional regulator/O6-methylguanine-DNA methyltransferase Ada [Ktedonobacter sp. SOSP1-52]